MGNTYDIVATPGPGGGCGHRKCCPPEGGGGGGGGGGAGGPTPGGGGPPNPPTDIAVAGTGTTVLGVQGNAQASSNYITTSE